MKMDSYFSKYKEFICVYIDDVLVYNPNKETHVGHLRLVLNEFAKQEIVISSKKISVLSRKYRISRSINR